MRLEADDPLLPEDEGDAVFSHAMKQRQKKSGTNLGAGAMDPARVERLGNLQVEHKRIFGDATHGRTKLPPCPESCTDARDFARALEIDFMARKRTVTRRCHKCNSLVVLWWDGCWRLVPAGTSQEALSGDLQVSASSGTDAAPATYIRHSTCKAADDDDDDDGR